MAHKNCKFCIRGKNGQLYVYENKIEIERKGGLSFLTHGMSGNKSIPFSSITSVQIKEGGFFTNGYIQFSIHGGKERQGGLMSAIDDENTVVFTKANNALASQIKSFIEQRVEELENSRGTTVINQQLSPADEVMKLKQLHDAGIITKDEFDLKKKQLLGL